MIGLHTPSATRARTGNKLSKVAYSWTGERYLQYQLGSDDPALTMTAQTNNRENPGFGTPFRHDDRVHTNPRDKP